MRSLLLSTILLACLFPQPLYAQEALSRRDAFIRLWESILRPVKDPIYEEPYIDVLEHDPGYREITYAKQRNLLLEEGRFHPDGQLILQDALLWLYRLNNTTFIDEMEFTDLPELLRRYPLVAQDADLSVPVSRDLLEQLIERFTKMRRDEVHEISFYADFFQGKGTAFGETFDMYALTAAHRTFPHNTLVKVTNLDDGKTITVRINDRGPYVHGRSLDLSLASFEHLAPRSRGILRNVTIERLGDVGLVGEGIGEVTEEREEKGEKEEKEERQESSTGHEKEDNNGKEARELDTSLCPPAPSRRYQKRITREVRFHRGIPHTFRLGESLDVGSTKFFVIRQIIHPDGIQDRLEQWINPENERFTFVPEIPGTYSFLIGNAFGRQREFVMKVEECA